VQADVVLEGGGVKGIGLVGALSVLEEAGYTFEKVAGTSAGAIVGALVAAGAPTGELREIMEGLDYLQFKDKGLLDRFGLLGKGLSLLLENGVYEGAHLSQWLAGLLEQRGAATFGDLRIDDPGSSLPEDRRYRLVVMASDISCGRLRRLPWDFRECYDLDPDGCPVSESVRASMSIPFFYEPFRLEYVRHDEKGDHPEEVVLVDGGMLSNFPVDVFDRTDGRAPRWPTFGIKLSARPTAEEPPQDVSGPLGLVRAMVRTMTSFHDQLHLDAEDVLARTIFVDTTGVKATDFDLDRPTQQRLYDNGRAAAAKFLESWDFDAYKARFRPT
jgi:NTE family protein